jgi:hypothetical protein
VRALQHGLTLAWFFFATATLAVSIVLLIRNLWGFFWTALVVGSAYLASQELDIRYLGVIVSSIAGYLAVESIRHSSQQLSIINRIQGSGCDAERVAYWWGLPARLIGTMHLMFASSVSVYAGYLAINPYWNEIVNYLEKFIAT